MQNVLCDFDVKIPLFAMEWLYKELEDGMPNIKWQFEEWELVVTVRLVNISSSKVDGG